MKRLNPKIMFFVLLLAMTMPPLVPGQQYTGVKSVESSDSTEADNKSSGKIDRGSGGGSAGISARSIDKYEANELPESDSKIIKLSIKQIEPQVASGLRGARNLGFSADAALNAIPGGLNNELTNGDLKYPVTPSSTVAKDSYGNPVTPYLELGTTGLESVGFIPEANKDNLHGPNNHHHGNLNFKLPSYASGIIEPVQFPPVASALPQQNQPPLFLQSATTPRAPTTAFQFVNNAKIPTIGDGQITFAQKPLNGLIPPLFPGEQLPGYKVDIGTERSSIFVKDPFGSPSLDKGLTLPHENPPVNFNQGAPQNSQVPLQIPLSIPPFATSQPQTPQPSQPQFPQPHQNPHQPQYQPTTQSQQTPQQPQFKPSEAPVQKFTGSFGGAPGLLGSQQNLGTVYTSTPQPVKPASPQTYPTSPTTFFQPTISQAPSPTKAPNKFTGSFGGAPGFLGNQQNLGTAYKPTPPTITSTPQRPVSFQPQPQPQPQPQYPQTQAPSIIRPPSPFQPQPSYQPQQPTQSPGGSYTGTFTQQHNHNHQQPPQSQSPATQRPGQYGGNKFTGSFGGAPGLLGNQKQPGSHVKPDGSILPPSAPGIGFSSTTGSSIRPVAVASSGTSFTGSFGGPPGVLRPFDNVKG